MSKPNNANPRTWRACMVCAAVQSEQQFRNRGCPNCDDFLELRGSVDAIQDCTSTVFEGVITLTDPMGSWVAKWQRLQGYVPGMYATKVVGILPNEYISACENAGVKYIPRDGSSIEDEQ
ncbi:Hypothetical protein R9X50_00694000 [Acrodontium crateriforme]|uniref:Transcription elongation factor SPT4 n=1 Tax=Acrodontium crateriforme TaxID=150365 RepID=A0AAQ3R765_9PEZI|nr:Hypothetical protein R9X50_00694000 [Acrodontium crateriforme]